MIRSMTGFGAASGVVAGRRLTVELRSVNHRFFTATLRLTNELGRFEWEVRELLKRGIGRGHITLSVRHDSADAGPLSIDEERFAAYVAVLKGLVARHGLTGGVELDAVLRLPDVFGGAREPADAAGAELLALCRAAMDDFTASRTVEGGRLATYLGDCLGRIEAALMRIADRAPERVVQHRDRLRAAVTELAGGVQVDPSRLAVEVAVLAERYDVGEEVSRFQSHIAAFRETLASAAGEPVGKRLGFLLQEMLREANTTGSKANDLTLTDDVVRIKEELERLREQVENLE
jgi:uncharacterized protein (TIGR00255 family)